MLDTVWTAASATETPTKYEFITVAGSLIPGASATIERRWDYFVTVDITHNDATVGMVEIMY